MKKEKEALREPLAFLIGVLALEGILAILAVEGLWWCGVLLAVLLSTIQIVTLMLVWFAFRLLIRMNDRLKNLETKGQKQ